MILHKFIARGSPICLLTAPESLKVDLHLGGGCWHGYLSGRGADLHIAQLMPPPLSLLLQ